jgi:anaerobic ribonucleoside-triphosphate reductase activating protein
LTSAAAVVDVRNDGCGKADPPGAAAAEAHSLNVGGLTAFTATDYPGKLSCVVYVQGCPWRCSYCHNPELQSRTAAPVLSWPEVLARLQRRVGLLDAVVFSGGEPTLDPGLPQAMRDVKALGFAVGLHTAGAYPRRLREVLPLVDWVGLDVKTGFDRYDALTERRGSGERALGCVQAVLASGVACELRTTVHPLLHTEAELLALARTLRGMGATHYAVQLFRAQGCGSAPLCEVPAADLLSPQGKAELTALFPHFTLRTD